MTFESFSIWRKLQEGETAIVNVSRDGTWEEVVAGVAKDEAEKALTRKRGGAPEGTEFQVLPAGTEPGDQEKEQT